MRPINVESFIEWLENHRPYESDLGYCECKQEVLSMLRVWPTIEIKVGVDLENAYWKSTIKGEYFCTACLTECDYDLYNRPLLTGYCGNCGAKMEGTE